jgi:predicted dehydrogenase
MIPRLRLGILSTARINERSVFDVLPHLPEVQVVAVASRDTARAEAYARRFGVACGYGDYEALLAARDVDAVYVSLPNSLHALWVARALFHGKHVLCEKPLSADPDAVRELAAEAAARRLQLREAMHYRVHPDVRHAVALATSGVIGSLVHLAVYFIGDRPAPGDVRLDRSLEGGALMDAGCYCLDLIRWMSGDPTPKVRSAHLHGEPGGVDLTVSGVLDCRRAVTASFSATLDGTTFECHATAYGSEGSMSLSFPFLPVVPMSREGRVLFECRLRTGGTLSSWSASGPTSYFFQMREFAAAVRSGAPTESTTLRAGATLLRDVREAGSLAGSLATRSQS